MHTINDLFLRALSGNNKGRAPVWLMRQAGRYLPSYQELRARHSLLDLFLTPHLAAAITVMPIEQLGLDAAILFSDITIPILALGLKLTFAERPQVIPSLSLTCPFSCQVQLSHLDPVFEAVHLAKQQLHVPLIGFCGGPFTVASYLIEGGETEIKRWIYHAPAQLLALLDQIAEVSIHFLQGQIDAGADAFQIFDTSAHILSKDHFRTFCLPYYQRMFRAVKAPALLFAKHLGHHLLDLISLPCCLSLDAPISLPEIRKQTSQPLQGNLDSDLLFAPLSVIQKQARGLIESMHGDPAFIAGLGSGIKPGTSLLAVKTLVTALQS